MSKELTLKLALEGAANYIDALGGDSRKYRQTLASEAKKPDFWEGYVPEPDNTCNNALRIQGKAYPRTCKKCGLGPCVELAQQALDKKAENARELGLDYEAQETDRSVMYTYPSKPEPIPCGKPIGILMKKKGDEHMKLYPLAEQSAQPTVPQDIPDLIAGALGVSRGTAYDMMREALAEQPAPATELREQEPAAWKWQQAPIRTAWGAEMVVASVAIDKDHTLSLYCEHDQTTKVDAMFAQRTWVNATTWRGLTDEQFQAIKDSLFRQEGWDGEGWDLALKEAIEAKLKEKNNG